MLKKFLSVYLLLLSGAFAGMLGFSWLECHTLVTLGTVETLTACLLLPGVVAFIGPLFLGGAIAMRFMPDGLGGVQPVALVVVFVMSYAPLGYLAGKFLGRDIAFARVLSAILLLAYSAFCTYGILCVGAGL